MLNKADTVDAQSLLRVYGALMWALGKVVQTPEVCRVYLGSFWDAPLKLEENRLSFYCYNYHKYYVIFWHYLLFHTIPFRPSFTVYKIASAKCFHCCRVINYSIFLPWFRRALLEREKRDLISEMMSLPKNAVVRRINELVKRSRSVKVRFPFSSLP